MGHRRTSNTQRNPYAKYRLPDGRQVQKKLGSGLDRARTSARWLLHQTHGRDWLRHQLDEAGRGTLPGMVRTGATFADAAAEYLRYIEHDPNRKPTTLPGYRSIIHAHMLPAFGETALESITTPKIESWITTLDLAASTRTKTLVVMHGIFERARRRWGLPINPVADVEKPPTSNSGEIAGFSPDEVMALVRAAASEQDAAIYLIAAFTGLRAESESHCAGATSTSPHR